MSTYIEVKFKDISFNCVPNGATCDPYTGDLWGNYDIILRTALGTNYDTPINIQMQPDGSGVPVTPGLFRYAEIKYQNYTVETFPVVNWLSTAFAAGQSTLPNMALILDNAAVMDNSRVILWFSGGPGATDISKISSIFKRFRRKEYKSRWSTLYNRDNSSRQQWRTWESSISQRDSFLYIFFRTQNNSSATSCPNAAS